MENSKLFTLYIGVGYRKDGTPIPAREVAAHIKQLEYQVAQIFGGYTAQMLDGGYIRKDGQYVHEKSLRLEITAPSKMQQAVKECATAIRNMFQQETVLVTMRNVDEAMFV